MLVINRIVWNTNLIRVSYSTFTVTNASISITPSKHRHTKITINLNTIVKQGRGLMAVNINTESQR